MKIPETIRVCGLIYKVVFEKNMDQRDGLVGQHRSKELIIKLQDGDYAPQKIEQVFFHEVLHAIDLNYNNDKMTEEEIDRVSSGLYQVLSDNNLLKE